MIKNTILNSVQFQISYLSSSLISHISSTLLEISPSGLIDFLLIIRKIMNLSNQFLMKKYKFKVTNKL